MKKSYLKILIFLSIFITPTLVRAQSGDLLNILVKKNILSQQEADSVRAETAAKEQAKRDKEKNQYGFYLGKALQISGLIQARYQGFEQSTAINSFDLHRARIDVKGDLNSQWSYEIYTEFAGGTKLLDAYTTYKVKDYLKLTAGQFKVPFSAENLNSDSQLEFIDRAQVVEALAARSKDVIGNQNGRDIGIQISGSFGRLNGTYLFDYAFGIFNGAGYDVTSDNNNHKDIAGRLAVHPVKNLVIGADFYDGMDVFAVGSTVAATHKRNRQGIDGKYIVGALTLKAEYDKGTDNVLNRNGWYGQASYFAIPGKLEPALRYDTYDPSQTSGTDRMTNYMAGMNYYFNEWAKFTVDYVDRREQTSTQIQNNIIEVQLQLTF